MPSALSDRLERASVYQLLARLWAEEPGDLLTELAAEPLAAAWRQIGGCVPDHSSEIVRSLLDEEYCRLFIGPKGHLPPIQSVWASGELDTGVTASLREFDSIIGFDEPWEFSIIPDHLGNELWAMSQILLKSSGLRTDELAVAEDLAGQFFSGHLNWSGDFLNAVIEREGDRFYGTLSTVTQRFLNDEATRFETPVAQD